VKRFVRRRPSPATVISLIALFVALGGTSYAAFGIPRNSVGSQQVINGSLQTADLSSKAIGKLRGRRGPAGALGAAGPKGDTGPSGAQGSTGAQGPAGSTGPKGDQGDAGAVVVARIRQSGQVTVGQGQTAPWPLAANTWTQGAGKANLVSGEMTFQTPAACDRSGGFTRGGQVNVYIDGVQAGSEIVPFDPQYPPPNPFPLSFNPTGVPGVTPIKVLFAPDVDAQHVLTATVSDTCAGAGQDITFDSFKIDVIAVD